MKPIKSFSFVVFVAVFCGFKSSRPPAPFNSLITRAQLSFTMPVGMVEVPVVTNTQMNYDYALKLTDKNFEVRYAIRPLDTMVASYQAWEKNKDGEIRANPNNLHTPAFLATCMNISGGNMQNPSDFPTQAIRNEFKADWGSINVCQTIGEFGKGYHYCLAMTIHKDNVAEAYIFFMTNDKSQLTTLLPVAFHSLVFK